eukprot:TRINITY_DN64331_c0_g3_i1.p1 TRINITY_DN64331_c0_g3~~TRINITY_DN64331_c0_g3_i1.p1  ORF type:complete len:638 (-),score=92.90 TRINITY_DN64331_c0_g3_i1:409-2322(-)
MDYDGLLDLKTKAGAECDLTDFGVKEAVQLWDFYSAGGDSDASPRSIEGFTTASPGTTTDTIDYSPTAEEEAEIEALAEVEAEFELEWEQQQKKLAEQLSDDGVLSDDLLSQGLDDEAGAESDAHSLTLSEQELEWELEWELEMKEEWEKTLEAQGDCKGTRDDGSSSSTISSTELPDLDMEELADFKKLSDQLPDAVPAWDVWDLDEAERLNGLSYEALRAELGEDSSSLLLDSEDERALLAEVEACQSLPGSDLEDDNHSDRPRSRNSTHHSCNSPKLLPIDAFHLPMSPADLVVDPRTNLALESAADVKFWDVAQPPIDALVHLCLSTQQFTHTGDVRPCTIVITNSTLIVVVKGEPTRFIEIPSIMCLGLVHNFLAVFVAGDFQADLLLKTPKVQDVADIIQKIYTFRQGGQELKEIQPLTATELITKTNLEPPYYSSSSSSLSHTNSDTNNASPTKQKSSSSPTSMSSSSTSSASSSPRTALPHQQHYFHTKRDLYSHLLKVVAEQVPSACNWIKTDEAVDLPVVDLPLLEMPDDLLQKTPFGGSPLLYFAGKCNTLSEDRDPSCGGQQSRYLFISRDNMYIVRQSDCQLRRCYPIRDIKKLVYVHRNCVTSTSIQLCQCPPPPAALCAGTW